jgi:hypothetical protein
MSQVISFAAYRNAKIRDRLLAFALNGEAAIIQTRSALIRAERMICLDHAAEIRNSLGQTFFVDYDDIREVRPGSIPQISAVSDAGDWVVPSDGIARTEPSRVLAFARRGRRS